MGKNIPITARVNKGLFNQEKGVTEPILNVGPAGVYGDNTTSNAATKSPAKKKGFSISVSPLKAHEPGHVETSQNQQLGPEGSIKTIKKRTTTGDLVNKKGGCKAGFTMNAAGKCVQDTPESTAEQDAKYIKKCYEADGKTRKRGVAGCSWADENIVDPEPDTTTGSPDKKEKGELTLRTNDSGTAQTSLQRRNNIRSGIHTSRRVGKYRRQMGKYGTFDAEGKFTANDNLSQSDLNKLSKSQSRYEISNNELTNVKNQSKQNQTSGYGANYLGTQGTVRGEGRDLKQNELSVEEQKNLDIPLEDVDSASPKKSKFFRKGAPMKLKYFGK
jgi:hypothetical protein